MSGALPFLRGDADSVARRGGAIVSRAAFLTEIEELAAQLPDRPFVVNFCADRYRFAVGWAAAMRRGQVTLLPSGRDGAAVAGLREDYAALYVLTDDDTDDLPGPRFDYPPLAGTGGVHEVPAFAPEQVAAVLFTSGSTGRSPAVSPRARHSVSTAIPGPPWSRPSRTRTATAWNRRSCCRCSMGCC
jgi:acyl-CoA synthetase (AMP-forming)/AMP-acid ligase II